MKTKIFILLILVISTFGCNDFLSENPVKRSSVRANTASELEGILTNYIKMSDMTNNACQYCNDDYAMDVDLYKDSGPGTSSDINLYDDPNDQDHRCSFGMFNVSSLKDLPINRIYYSKGFERIANANYVLSDLDRVEGEAKKKATVKAEAYMIRAENYITLLQTYCLPQTKSNKNTKGLGLPLMTKFKFVKNTNRATLEECWNLVFSDLTNAEKDGSLLKTSLDPFTLTTAAAYGLHAEAYLAVSNYNKALEMANKALAIRSNLIDYNVKFKGHSVKSTVYTHDYSFPGYTMDLPVTADYNKTMTESKMSWGESYMFRFAYLKPTTLPSKELLNSFNKKWDLRYRYHVIPKFGQFYSGGNLRKSEWPGYVFFLNMSYDPSSGYVPYGPTISEMYLIKAECLARLNKFGEALSTLNKFRASRFDTNAPSNVINLNLSGEALINAILKDKRLEFPFSKRFFDLKRINFNDDLGDDVTVTHTFYETENNIILDKGAVNTVNIGPKSLLWAMPLSTDDIVRTPNQQNKYK